MEFLLECHCVTDSDVSNTIERAVLEKSADSKPEDPQQQEVERQKAAVLKAQEEASKVLRMWKQQADDIHRRTLKFTNNTYPGIMQTINTT